MESSNDDTLDMWIILPSTTVCIVCGSCQLYPLRLSALSVEVVSTLSPTQNLLMPRMILSILGMIVAHHKSQRWCVENKSGIFLLEGQGHKFCFTNMTSNYSR